MNAQAALNSFWNGYGWTAWEENSVPEEAFSRVNEYITYSSGQNYFDEPMMLTASLWQRSTSWTGTVAKMQEIAEDIGLVGKFIKTDDGYLWIKRGTPFAQRMSDEDPAVRRIYMNIEVEFFTNK
jgi:hypothetical protein